MTSMVEKNSLFMTVCWWWEDGLGIGIFLRVLRREIQMALFISFKGLEEVCKRHGNALDVRSILVGSGMNGLDHNLHVARLFS